ncbi:hypothetical protein USB125703_00161 [Pseudoclavibacter triregionum]|nr:hypothetical protein USB125703_00161 [Pseudoclavibacter triregionum]
MSTVGPEMPALPPALPGDGALVDPGASHLVDERGARWAITRSDAPVVYLSPARRRLLARGVREKETTILVTGEDSVLTPAYREVAGLTRARWVVEGPHGVRDALIGRRLRTPEDVIGLEAGMDRALEHARDPGGEPGIEVIVSCSIRHRNRERAPFGLAAARVAAALAPDAALRWGPTEPLGAAWDDDEVGAWLRARLARTPWIFAVGAAGADSVAASIRCRPTKQGSEEILTVRAGCGPLGPDADAHAADRAEDALDALAEAGVPLFATALGRVARRDLLAAPALEAPAFPLALLVGAPALRRLDGGPADIADRVGGMLAGPTRRESLIAPIGEGLRPAALERLTEVLEALGPIELAEVMGDDTMASLLGPDWSARAEARRAEAGEPGDDGDPAGSPGDGDGPSMGDDDAA